MPAAESSSKIFLLVIVGLVVVLVLGSYFLIHRTDVAPKPPLHTATPASH